MTPRERKTWLASLKVGDEVAVIVDGGRVEIRPVTARSELRIWLGCDRAAMLAFSVSATNGRYRDPYGSRSIEPVTDEYRAIDAEYVGRARLRQLAWWSALTRDQIARIITIVDGAA